MLYALVRGIQVFAIRTRVHCRVRGRSLVLAVTLALATTVLVAPMPALANNAGGAPANSGLTSPVLRVEPVAGHETLSQLAWSTQSGAAQYEVQCALDNLFRPNRLTGSVRLDAATSRYRFGGLRPGTTYFYRVRAVAPDGRTNGPWSNVVFFIDGKTHDGANRPIAVAGTGYETWIHVPITLDARLSHDPDGTIAKYEWDLDGDGVYDVTTIEPTVVHTPTKPGNRKVHLRVTDNSGHTATDRTFVKVRYDAFPPTAVIVGPVEATVGDLVFFDGSLSRDNEGFIQSYSWDFAADGEYEHTSLLPTCQYTFFVPGEWVVRLDVRDANGNVGTAYHTILVTQPTEFPPAAPTGLVAADTPDDDNGSITLSWNANAETDLLGYRIYRGMSADGPFMQVADAVSNNFVDTGLFDGATYYYHVIAYDAVGLESPPSNTVSAVPVDDLAPTAPAYIFAEDVAGDESGQVVVSWLASVARDLAGYVVTVVDPLGTVIANADVGIATSHTFEGLDNGVTYMFTVRAYDDAGNFSALSDKVYAAPVDDVAPAAPTDVSVLAPEGGSALTIRWSGSDSADVAGQRLYRDGAPIAELAADVRDYDDLGVENGVEYAYHVEAYDTSGNVSEPSNKATGRPHDALMPGAPELSPIGVPVEGGALELTWRPSDVGQTIGFAVYRDGGLVTEINDLGRVWHIDTGLINGTSYAYHVVAYGPEGRVSQPSNTVNGVPSDTVPPAVPVGLSAADTPDDEGGAIDLAWTANTDDTAGYRIYRDGVLVADAAGAGATTFTDSGLTNGAAYTYTVTAYDAAGNESAPSASANAVSADNLAPEAPEFLHVAPLAEGGAIVLTWSGSVSPDTAGYRIYRGGVLVADAAGAGATTFTDSGLTNGVAYTYTVTAYDAAGNESAPSAQVTGTPADTVPPAAPVGLSAADTPDDVGGAIDLAWTANTDDTAGYRIYRDGVLVADAAGAGATTFTDSGLTNGVTYTYTVTAYDAAGNESAPSAPVNAVAYINLDVIAPTVPGSLKALPGNAQVTLTWDASYDTFGVTGYEIWIKRTVVGEWRMAAEVDSLAYTPLGLDNGITYYFKIRALDDVGNVSGFTADVGATPIRTPAPLETVRIEDTDPRIQYSGPWAAFFDPRYSAGSIRALNANGSASLTFSGTGVSVKAYSTEVWNRGMMDVFLNGAFVTRVDLYSATLDFTVPVFESQNLRDGTHTIRLVWTGEKNPASSMTIIDIDRFDITTGPDVIAPVVPSGLVVTDKHNDESGAVAITWNANSEADLAGYRLYRSDSINGPFMLVTEFDRVTSYTDPGLLAHRVYYYQLSAVDFSGNESARSVTASGSPRDDVPPAVPTGLSVLDRPGDEGDALIVSWTANTELDLAGYRVYRSASATGPFALVATLGKESTTHTNTGLAKQTTYHYRVTALDTAGNESAQSPAASARTVDNVRPSDPTSLVISDRPNDDGTALILSWTASTSGDVVGYRVYRAVTPEGPFTMVRQQAGLSYTDSGLSPTVTYYYYVTAIDAEPNESGSSCTGSGVPREHVAPSATRGLFIVGGDGYASLAWLPATDNIGVMGYEVWMREGSGGSYEKLADNASTAYWKVGLSNGTSYTFRVRAFDGSGNLGAWSNEYSVVPVVATGQLLTTRIEETDPAIVYTGTWHLWHDSRHSGGSMTHTRQAGASATLTFSGTGVQVRVVGTNASNRGMVDVYINGAYQTTVDMYSSLLATQWTIFEATGLADGQHTLTLIATGTKNVKSGDTIVDIDCFDIIRPN
ncbi:MAG: PKD domain-containing protein [Clostridiales bacterium]|nr:PKD domain-containing protein [Clostridiales bacterium]